MDQSPIPIQRPPVSRRLRRFAFRTALIVAAAAVIGLCFRAYFVHRAEKEFEAAVADLDPSERAWTWEEVEARRETIATDQNSAVHITAAAKMLPPDWPKQPARKVANLPPPQPAQEAPVWFDRLDQAEPNRRLDAELAAEIRDEWQALQAPIAEARRVNELPRGRYSVVLAPNPLNTLLPHAQNTRAVNALLRLEAAERGERGDLAGAIASVRAIVNTNRALIDEPFLITALVRINGDSLAVSALERVLAQGEPTLEDLKTVTALIESEEATLPRGLVTACRGERGTFTRIYEHVLMGKVRLADLTNDTRPNTGLWERATDWCWTGPVFYHHRPALFRYLTRFVELAKQPRQERRLGCLALDAELNAKYRGSPSDRLCVILIPAIDKVFNAHDRVIAQIRCARTGVAAELYRRDHKRWPASLDQLVPGYLKEVPDDPFGTGPIRSMGVDGGFIIYSVGPIGEDGGVPTDPLHRAPSRTEPYFRLWSPDQRGLEPEHLPR